MSRLTSNASISIVGALVLFFGAGIGMLSVHPQQGSATQMQAKAEEKTSVQGTMTCSFVSDTSNTITGGGNAVNAYVYPDWTAGSAIPGASWIWKTFKVVNPSVTQAYTFNKAFYLTLPVTSASIAISSDNRHEVLMNGTSYFSGDSNWTAPTNNTFATNANFKEGANTLSVIGTNWGLDTTPELNPAAIIYKFTVTAAYCGVQPPVDTNVKLSLDLLLHGIGKAGDSVKPGVPGGGNTDPKHKPRQIKVEMYNSQNQKVKSVQGTVTYESGSGSFKGLVDMGTVPAGNYLINAKFTQSLDTQIGGIQTIHTGTNTLPQQSFVTGDVNNDGAVSLNVLDFTILVDCIKGLPSCTAAQKDQADLDDNGKVDQFDFNLFLREITHVTH